MQTYLSVTPEDIPQAAQYTLRLVYMAYRIGSGSVLLRQSLPQVQGGFMAISDQNAPHIERPEQLCAAVLRECGRQRYSGVLLDFEETPCSDRKAFVRRLEADLRNTGTNLYLPESYAEGTQSASILISTAISGGSLAERLKEAAAHYGGTHRLALDIQRIRMDFSLPALSGEGTPLTMEELRTRMQRESPSLFFSSPLCCRYFTYIHNQRLHFVMLDDTDTIRQKLRTGSELGIRTAFLLWPEVKDIAGELLQ